MEDKMKQLLSTILYNNDIIEAEDIPNIELYMDQVTTFMEKHLADSKRYPDDKIMTKTMVNNYTKNQLLPPSTKKKYSKNHIFLLIMIYYYKNMLSISDIQNLLSPLSGKYFPKNPSNGLSLENIYTELMEQLRDSNCDTEKHILNTFEESRELFSSYQLSKDDREELTMHAFISQLCYDIYVRKQLIERLIDQMYPQESKPAKKDKKPKK